MIASWRGVAVLAAIAVALAVLAATGGAPAPVDRAIAPGVDVAQLDRVAWSRPGAHDVVVTRGHDGAWTWNGAPVAAGAIDGVLTALRGGRWQRRADAATAGAVDVTLTAGALTLGVAQPLAGTDQVWVVAGDRAELVDAWLAHALAPPPLALRVARPVAAAVAGSIELAGDRGVRAVDVASRRLTDGVATLRLAPAVTAALDHALDGLAIVALPAAPLAAAGDGLRVTVQVAKRADRWAQLAGPCPGRADLVAMRASSGDGCVEAAAAAALTDVYDRLAASLAGAVDVAAIATLVDRRVAADAATVTMSDGVAIAVDARRAATGDTDPDALRALAGALASTCDVAAIPAAPPRASFVVTDDAGVTTHAEIRGDVVVRSGEPVGLRPPPAALALLLQRGELLATRRLWVDEPYDITRIDVDGASYKRGAVIGEWDTAPARFATVTALAAAAARPRPIASPELPADAAFSHAHHVEYRIEPPNGAGETRAFDVALAPDGQCAVRSGDRRRFVDRALCDAAAAAAIH